MKFRVMQFNNGEFAVRAEEYLPVGAGGYNRTEGVLMIWVVVKAESDKEALELFKKSQTIIFGGKVEGELLS